MISSIGSNTASSSGLAALQAVRAKAFSKADSDGSGKLGVDEFKSLMADRPWGAPGGPGGPGGPPPAGGVQGAGGTVSTGAMDSTDLDSLFATADTDGDGQLTQDELDAGMQASMQGFQSTMALFGADGSGASAGTGGNAAVHPNKQLVAMLQKLIGQQHGQGSDGSSNNDTANNGGGNSIGATLALQA